MNNEDIIEKQKKICEQYNATWLDSPSNLKVGIAKNVREGLLPINGLRHKPEGDTTGWYIWAGEDTYSEDPDFFQPLHVEHLEEWAPGISKFLGLPAGYRFLTDSRHEDVWEDKTLLE